MKGDSMTQKYYLGLDMGTSSLGWAVTDSNYNLLRAKGKDLWGVRLFPEAEPQYKTLSPEYLEEPFQHRLQIQSLIIATVLLRKEQVRQPDLQDTESAAKQEQPRLFLEAIMNTLFPLWDMHLQIIQRLQSML